MVTVHLFTRTECGVVELNLGYGVVTADQNRVWCGGTTPVVWCGDISLVTSVSFNTFGLSEHILD